MKIIKVILSLVFTSLGIMVLAWSCYILWLTACAYKSFGGNTKIFISVLVIEVGTILISLLFICSGVFIMFHINYNKEKEIKG